MKKILALMYLLGFSFIFLWSEHVSSERGTSIDEAPEIAFGDTIKDEFSYWNLEDEYYYKFIVNEPGSIIFAIKNKMGKQFQGTILNSNGVTIKQFETNEYAGSEETVGQVGLEKGTYYIKISPYFDAYSTQFEFTITFTKGGYL